jgi:hypothetical protein
MKWYSMIYIPMNNLLSPKNGYRFRQGFIDLARSTRSQALKPWHLLFCLVRPLKLNFYKKKYLRFKILRCIMCSLLYYMLLFLGMFFWRSVPKILRSKKPLGGVQGLRPCSANLGQRKISSGRSHRIPLIY